MSRPIKLSILGNDYLIRSDEDEQHVKEIAQFVRDKFEQISSQSDGISERKTAILAAFYIASEYFQLLKQYDEMVKQFQEREEIVQSIRERARKLNYQIDAVVD
ncbi:conserved hypothetical protein [uncultured Desulfatiglans sp.]|nr:conserved hypothetical protein [uncultured Desulfatiglans sp.]